MFAVYWGIQLGEKVGGVVCEGESQTDGDLRCGEVMRKKERKKGVMVGIVVLLTHPEPTTDKAHRARAYNPTPVN